MEVQVNSIFSQGTGRAYIAIAAVVVTYLVLAIASSRAKAPWCDEGYFAEPAFNLISTGKMATVSVPPSPADDPKTEGTDQYTYYVMPLDLVIQAAWYKLVGFGIFQMRLISVFFGALALLAWFLILRSMRAPLTAIAWAIAILALDYTFVRAASDGRMDMMSAALGFLASGVFLTLRKRAFGSAVLGGATCAAASAFTHPIGGLLACAALAAAILWYDWRRLRWYHVVFAAVPFVLFAAAWGAYIAQDPRIFRAQFSSISSGRLSAWKAPVDALKRELLQRYALPFGLEPGPVSPMKRVKAIVLTMYAAAALLSLIGFRELKSRGFGLIAPWLLIYFSVLCFLDGTKVGAYLIHIVPLLAMSAGIWLWILWTRGFRFIAVAATAVLLIVQLSGTAYVLTKDEYDRGYLPTIRFLQQHRAGADVMGVSELGFGLGFNGHLIDDRRLGFYNGKKADTIVLDETYTLQDEKYRTDRPDIYAYIENLLSRYHVVFQNGMFRVYERT